MEKNSFFSWKIVAIIYLYIICYIDIIYQINSIYNKRYPGKALLANLLYYSIESISAFSIVITSIG